MYKLQTNNITEAQKMTRKHGTVLSMLLQTKISRLIVDTTFSHVSVF